MRKWGRSGRVDKRARSYILHVVLSNKTWPRVFLIFKRKFTGSGRSKLMFLQV